MENKIDDLEKRVNQYNTFSLPGQPIGCHMGTSYLINDLWTEVKRLRAASQPPVQGGRVEGGDCGRVFKYPDCPNCKGVAVKPAA